MDVLQKASGDQSSQPADQAGVAQPGSGTDASAASRERSLLTWNRLDLAFKLHYLESVESHPSAFSEQLYDDHLRALTDAADPTEAAQARSQLGEVFRTVKAAGKSGVEVRLAADGSVLDGGAELACAMILGHPIRTVPTEAAPILHDARFFQQHGVDRDNLDAAVLRYVERAPDCFVALIWPAAQGSDEDLEEILGPLVYRKAVSLDPNGAHNLLSQVYEGEAWLGDPAQNYPGIRNKLVPCFGRSGPLRVAIFQKRGLDEVLAAKQAVRDRFGLGKHSIHITDSHEEAVRIARLLLNDRGVHFLNAAHPTRFPSTLRMAKGFEDYLSRNDIPAELAIVDSGMVLAAHGLREAQDVDFISPIEVEDDGLFSRHGPGAHDRSLGDLLNDPRNHFHYWGLKLISLEQVARMKRRRKVGRDLDDLGLIGPVLAGKSSHPRLLRAVNHIRFVAAKTRRQAIQATRRVGLYGALKRTQRALRGRRT